MPPSPDSNQKKAQLVRFKNLRHTSPWLFQGEGLGKTFSKSLILYQIQLLCFKHRFFFSLVDTHFTSNFELTLSVSH